MNAINSPASPYHRPPDFSLVDELLAIHKDEIAASPLMGKTERKCFIDALIANSFLKPCRETLSPELIRDRIMMAMPMPLLARKFTPRLSDKERAVLADMGTGEWEDSKMHALIMKHRLRKSTNGCAWALRNLRQDHFLLYREIPVDIGGVTVYRRLYQVSGAALAVLRLARQAAPAKVQKPSRALKAINAALAAVPVKPLPVEAVRAQVAEHKAEAAAEMRKTNFMP